MKFWDFYAVFYNRLNQLVPYRKHMTNVLRAIPHDDSGFILYIGCGSGSFLKNRKNIVGLDISFPMLRFAKRHNPLSMFVRADLNECLPFCSRAFSSAYSSNVLAYVRSPEQLIRELYRVLKPGGTLVLATLRRSFNPLAILREHIRNTSPFEVLRHFFLITIILFLNLLIIQKLRNGSYHGFEIDELKSILCLNGFCVVESQLSYADQDVLIVATKR